MAQTDPNLFITREQRRFLSVTAIKAPVSGLVVKLPSMDEKIRKGETVAVLESMKMEISVESTVSGRALANRHQLGDVVSEGDVIVKIREEAEADSTTAFTTVGLGTSEAQEFQRGNSALDALYTRLHSLTDDARPEAVKRRKSRGQLTTRECIDLICDDGTFREYGGLAIAAQRSARSTEDLVGNTPADGVVTGIGQIDGVVGVIIACDASVLAGTQGYFHHKKIDRAVEVAGKRRLPIVVLPEGGGGRPNDVDVENLMCAGLHLGTWHEYCKLAGVVPRVAVVSGYCFAGSAAMAGTSDVVIAVASSNTGMGGPAMIEGGGLGVVKASAVGPAAMLSTIGGVDVVSRDDSEAIDVAKKYLSYFTKRRIEGGEEGGEQSRLRDAIPLNRKRAYNVDSILEVVFDEDSLLELKGLYGRAVKTMLGRVAGVSVGIMASNCCVQGGALDVEAAEKAGKFMGLCSKFGVPIVTFVDCPGFMVGVDVEEKGMMRAASGLFLAGGELKVDVYAVILRRAVGLGGKSRMLPSASCNPTNHNTRYLGMALMGGSTKVPVETMAWCDAEISAMGVEGSVELGFKRELAAAEEEGGEKGRLQLFDKICCTMRERNGILNAASLLEVDSVIDPSSTRRRLAEHLVE